jgi:D-inositol-3-phosphate glycosyltransferase
MPTSAHIVLASLRVGLDDLSRLRSVAVRRKVPTTGVIHSLYGTSMIHGFLPLYLAQLSNCDALICSSSAGKRAVTNMFLHIGDCLKELGAKIPPPAIQLPIIPLGIDASSLPAKDIVAQRDLRVLYFGRLSLTSKADLYPLLMAWKIIRNRGIDVRLVIAGDDIHRLGESLRRFAEDLGCAAAVDIVSNPSRAAKVSLYRTADVFVSPSDTLQETFGLSILEAMAAGLPVVASDWSGYRELVVHGKTGYLVPTLLPRGGRAKNGLASAKPSSVMAQSTAIDIKLLIDYLTILLEDPGLRADFGAAAQKQIRYKYDWKVIIQQYEDLWCHLSQLAKEGGECRSGLRLDEFSVDQLFGHYATACFGPDAVVSPGPSATQNEFIRVCCARANLSYNGVAQVVQLLKANDMTIQELYMQVGPQKARLDEFVMYLGRLAKYGFIEINSQCTGAAASWHERSALAPI